MGEELVVRKAKWPGAGPGAVVRFDEGVSVFGAVGRTGEMREWRCVRRAALRACSWWRARLRAVVSWRVRRRERMESGVGALAGGGMVMF